MASRSGLFAPCLLAAAAFSAACAPRMWLQQDLQEWQGASVSELLDAWGPPLRTLTGKNQATVLVFESARELDHRLEQELRRPGARLGGDTDEPHYQPADRSECTLYFEIAADRVKAVRHEGAACDIVPRDPSRRQADPDRRR